VFKKVNPTLACYNVFKLNTVEPVLLNRHLQIATSQVCLLQVGVYVIGVKIKVFSSFLPLVTRWQEDNGYTIWKREVFKTVQNLNSKFANSLGFILGLD
jgi:hypothetical protein